MTVTFDIKMKDIYKNSALMTIGELKHNLFAVFGILILFLVCATVLMCSFTPVLLIIFTIVLALFIVPSILSFIINSAVLLMPPSGALEKNNFNTHSKTGERQGTPPFDVLCLPFLSINYRK